jgi:Cdc6-like AAA superfamily ATPase
LRFNPFRPNGFAPRTVFTGRIEETVALERMLFNTLNGNPQHFILHGERGIGKSSLLYIHRLIASGRVARADGEAFNFLVVSLNLDSTDTNETIIRKLGLALRTACAAQSRGKEFLKSAWGLLSRFEAAGVKLRDSAGDDSLDPMMALIEAYSKTCEDIRGFYDGILVIIDEADTAPYTAHLGSTLKALSERVALSDNNVLTIGLAGVSNLVGILRASHESSPRLLLAFN